MMELRDLLIQAKALSHHVAQPVYRHAAAKYGQTFQISDSMLRCEGTLTLGAYRLLQSLVALMQAVDVLDDAQAILKAGEAISATVDAIRAAIPQPRSRDAAAPPYWVGDRA